MLFCAHGIEDWSPKAFVSPCEACVVTAYHLPEKYNRLILLFHSRTAFFKSVYFQWIQLDSGDPEGKASACNIKDPDVIPGSGISPEKGNGKPYQYILPGKFHRKRSLVIYIAWECKESHITGQLHFSWIRQLATSGCEVTWYYFSPHQAKNRPDHPHSQSTLHHYLCSTNGTEFVH